MVPAWTTGFLALPWRCKKGWWFVGLARLTVALERFKRLELTWAVLGSFPGFRDPRFLPRQKKFCRAVGRFTVPPHVGMYLHKPTTNWSTSSGITKLRLETSSEQILLHCTSLLGMVSSLQAAGCGRS